MTEIFIYLFFLPTSPDPPLPIDFKCETHDLRSAVCQWGKGRDTHLYGSKRGTRYFVNNRYAVSLTKGNSRTVQSHIHRKHLQVLEYMDLTLFFKQAYIRPNLSKPHVGCFFFAT